jgi:hypothetical protein
LPLGHYLQHDVGRWPTKRRGAQEQWRRPCGALVREAKDERDGREEKDAPPNRLWQF